MSDDAEYYAAVNEGGEFVECPECGEECEQDEEAHYCPECGWSSDNHP